MEVGNAPGAHQGRELGLPLEVLRGSQAPCSAVCGTCGFLRAIPGGVSAPSCCAFIKRVIFKEVSGHWDLIKSGPGNWGLSACVTIHEAMSRISS